MPMFKWIDRWLFNSKLAKARQAMSDEDWKEARHFAKAAYRIDYENVEALSVLGMANFRLHRYESSAKYYHKITEISPNDFAARRNLAMTYAAMKQWKQARDLFQALASEKPGDRDLAEAFEFATGKLRDASAPPGSDPIKQAIAKRHWPKVISLARKALEQNPEDVDAMLHLGMACYHCEQIPEAIEWFGQAADKTRTGEDSHRHAPALYNLAIAAVKQCEWTTAVETLQTLHSMIRHGAPGTAKLSLASVLTNQIVCFRETRKLALARAAHAELMSVDPAAASRIDPRSLSAQLGAKIKSGAPLGARLDLAEEISEPSSFPPEPDENSRCLHCDTVAEGPARFCGKCGAYIASRPLQAV